MSVYGIGIDVVETVRIERSLERFGEKFKARVFTDKEREYCDTKKHAERHYAARFAAKEAISKAFGTGITDEVGWKDMEILRRDSGEPHVILHGKGKEFAEKKGIVRVIVSLTHADHYAAANAVALTE